MGRITIELSDEDIAKAERRAKNAGYSTEDYLHDVLIEDLRDETIDIVNRIGPPPELHCDSMERLEELINEGLNGGSRRYTMEDVQNRRRELIDTSIAQKRGKDDNR